MFNNLMVIPNVLALAVLSGMVVSKKKKACCCCACADAEKVAEEVAADEVEVVEAVEE